MPKTTNCVMVRSKLIKVSFPSRSGGRQITTERAQRRGMKLFLPTPQGISQAALRVGDSGGLLVVVINGLVFQCLHELRMQ